MRVELVTTLKRQATKILADLHTSKEPVLITEHGQPSAYLVDVDDYEFMQQRMAILEGVARVSKPLKIVIHFQIKMRKKNEQMAEVVWTSPALDDLNDIAEYIALSNIPAARKLVHKVFDKISRLESHP